MANPQMKPLRWVGPAKKELGALPPEVRQVMGYAIYLAQTGGKHPGAKPLKGYAGAGVLEIVEDFDKDTYRTVYTVRFADAVYVLHAFQKKATKGISTPRHVLELIEYRLVLARQLHAEEFGTIRRKERP